jgi:hypothetical protein
VYSATHSVGDDAGFLSLCACGLIGSESCGPAVALSADLKVENQPDGARLPGLLATELGLSIGRSSSAKLTPQATEDLLPALLEQFENLGRLLRRH